MVTLEHNGVVQEFKQWKFPGGEVGVQLLQGVDLAGHYRVSILGIPSSDDLIIALNLCDALGHIDELYIPYFPYARQDRGCHEGESFALSVYMNLVLSSSNFSNLVIVDPHSSVLLKQFNHTRGTCELNIIEQHHCTIKLPKFDCIVAPDKGALDKAKFTQPDVEHVFLNKTRTADGIVYEDYPKDTIKGNVCVVDDIADSCGSFLSLAKMLERTQPNLQSLNFYVTHGIFSKNCIFPMKMHYDNIYCYNLMNLDVDHMVEVIK